MSYYAQDRFKGFGLQTIDMMALQAPEPQAIPYTKVASKGWLAELLSPAPAPAPAPPPPPPEKTEQQKAEEELAALERAAQEAETERLVEEELDIGEPKTPWLLYGGLGLGALVLVGGVLFATRKKSAKVAGYRRRRRSR
jgi:nucleotide-binding universal stress UspA family protein